MEPVSHPALAHLHPTGHHPERPERLAALHPDSFEAYMDGKDVFIKEVDERAARWRRTSG